jgi:UTP--glucose-1-phosphate uridylyltransferase
MKIRKAVFPVAGFGTRMLPATKSMPKEMLTLIDKPLIHYGVEEAVNAGAAQIIFVTGSNKKPLEDYFDSNLELEVTLEQAGKSDLLQLVRNVSNMCDVIYIRQKEQKGLGHAILCARDIIGSDPFLVLLPDDIIMAEKPVTTQLIEVYEEVKAPVLCLMEVEPSQAHRYGIVKIKEKINDRLFKLADMIEKPQSKAPSNYAIIGRYILNNDIMKNLENISVGVHSEIQLTDAIREQALKEDVYGYLFEGHRFDCGNKLGFLEAIVNFAIESEEIGDNFKKILKSLGV